MTQTFEDAPLVELIAELRWEQDDRVPQFPADGRVVNQQAILNFNEGASTEFYMLFGGNVHRDGFSRMERLAPEGFPQFAGQPVFRFRPTDQNDQSLLFQIGPGLFSSHAMPPYKTWVAFRPILEKGVNILLQSRSAKDRDKPFSSLSLRYLDAFGENLTQGRDARTFIDEVLGLKIELPRGLSTLVAEDKNPRPSIQLQIPLKNGGILNFNVGEGTVNGAQKLIMDTMVLSITNVAANSEAVMTAFESAHSIIHDLFMDLTDPIVNLMKPKDD